MMESRDIARLQRGIARFYRLLGVVEQTTEVLRETHFLWEERLSERKSLNDERDRLVSGIRSFHENFQNLHVREVEWRNRVALLHLSLTFLVDEISSTLQKHRSSSPRSGR
ncbi:MAG: hypothetical protein VST70_02655 [Nitrospirota bacterium]|nr:hypothetical protein [Nitrospirota bacterium]